MAANDEKDIKKANEDNVETDVSSQPEREPEGERVAAQKEGGSNNNDRDDENPDGEKNASSGESGIETLARRIDALDEIVKQANEKLAHMEILLEKAKEQPKRVTDDGERSKLEKLAMQYEN